MVQPAPFDMVNHPPHYTKGAIECIQAIWASMSEEEYVGFLKGQVIKYMWRLESKENALEDVRKAGYYQQKLEEFLRDRPHIFGKPDFPGGERMQRCYELSNLDDSPTERS